MKDYINGLYARLEELSEKQLTLGHIEEADAVAGLLCRLHKLDGMDGDHFRESTKMTEFSREDAMRWAEHMQNADGTVGPHWTMDQTSAVADASGIPHDIPRWAWGVTMNMMYSDYYDVARKFGVNVPEFYAELARAISISCFCSRRLYFSSGSAEKSNSINAHAGTGIMLLKPSRPSDPPASLKMCTPGLMLAWPGFGDSIGTK